MEIKTFSPKQAEILRFAYNDDETLICDGAVRSGKTIVMSFAFVLWAMTNFDRTNFAICGKTVSNAERNILRPFLQIEGMPFTLQYKISTRMLTVKCGEKENYFYLFGGKDESSYALIQGLTLAGVLFDEVALMPQSFVDQAIARTLSFSNAKIWFNCNPESPNHWFYKEWITNEERKYKHLHFLMRDNPILTEKEIQRAESLFTGVFYERYILGRWVRAEGIIFPEFANNPQKWVINAEDVPKTFRTVEVGLDIGGNGSAYAMTCTGQGYDGIQYRLKAEKRQADEMNMEDIERFVNEFCGECEEKYNVRIDMINCDHVAVIVNTINDNTKYRAGLCYKPPLEDRVFLYSKLFASGKIKFVDGMCDDLIDEMQNLVFDEKSDRPIPLDDGSMQIDTYDSACYSESSYWHYIEV
ncbi:MAG: PBSX family phage terminase large subunit [Oscillospiraceae bacterium]|nr:PBSX family phage terminase large subunit [Oscillospiraceae bacterium]